MNHKLSIGLAIGFMASMAIAATMVVKVPSLSVANTNYVSEAIFTNGVTIGGVRNTTWPAGSSGNWTASGATNSTLAGNASANYVTATNGLKVTGMFESYWGNSEGFDAGYYAGDQNRTEDGINIGFFAGYSGTNSSQAVRVGRHAGYDAHGAQAVQIGHAAGQYAVDSSSSVAIGYLAGRYPLHSGSAVQIGASAGANATNSQTSVMVGAFSGATAENAVGAVLSGYEAGRYATNAGTSVMIGYNAGALSTNGVGSVLIGSYAGKNLSRDRSLVIESAEAYATNGNTGLIYGEFDNRVLRFNATTTISNAVSAAAGLKINNGSASGNFIEGNVNGVSKFTVSTNGQIFASITAGGAGTLAKWSDGGVISVTQNNVPTRNYVSMGFTLGSSLIGVATTSNGGYGWTSSTTDSLVTSKDTDFVRVSAGVAALTDASTNAAALVHKRLVVAKTGAYSVVSLDANKVITNEGASALQINTLPAAVSGLTYTFIVQDADGLEVLAVGDDTIRIATAVSAAAGNITATTIGNTVTLVAVNATEWIATSVVGTWTVN